MEMEISFEPGVSDDEYPVSSAKERGVGKRDDGLRRMRDDGYGRPIQLFLNPRNAPVIVSCELYEGLSMPDVLIPQPAAEEDTIARRDKLAAAPLALIALTGTDIAILLYLTRTALGTLFLIRIA